MWSAWVLAYAPVLAAEIREDPPEGWRRAQLVSRSSLALLSAGAIVDVSVGIAQLYRGSSTPALDAAHTSSAAALGVGIAGVAGGGLLAAGAIRREGTPCPSGHGLAALALEVPAVGLVLADPVLLSAGREPLPWWADWFKLAALPFAVLQIDAAERALGSGHPLLGLKLTPAAGGRGIAVAGVF